MNSLHPTRLGASFSAEFQLCPCSFNSDSVSIRQVFLGRPLLLLPCGFHLRACLVMLFWWFPQCVANPCPFPLFNLCVYGVLVCSLPKILTSDFVEPSDVHDFSEAVVDESLDF